MENLSKKHKIKLLWESTTGIDNEHLTLSESYKNFDEIIFVSGGTITGNGYHSEWRYLTNHLVTNINYINNTFGNVIINFKTSTRIWYDGSNQWLAKVYGIKY